MNKPTFFSALWLVAALLTVSNQPARAEEPGPLEIIRKQVKSPGEPFTLLVIADIKLESISKFKDAFTAAHKATRQEAGNLGYELHESVEKPGRFLIIEKWRNFPAMEKHFAEPHVTQLFATAAELLGGAPEFHVLLQAVPAPLAGSK